MSTITLTPPVAVNTIGVHVRPGLGRLVAVELRKTVDTRAGFWMLAGVATLMVIVVAVSSQVGDAADHTFASLLNVGVQPAAVLLPVVGILLISSEWSQRTGMITFALVPVRSRVLRAKLIAGMVLAIITLAVCAGIVAAGVLFTSPGIEGTWSDVAPLLMQSALYLTNGIFAGVAFGAIFLASTPAFLALFALPIAWTALASLSYFADVAPWLDTRLAHGPMTQEVLSATQWAHAATALALWMLLPLLIGIWRVTRREVSV